MSAEKSRDEQEFASDETVASVDLQQIVADQRRRCAQGKPFAAEQYLDHNPSLAADADAALDIIYNEKLLRQGAGETPSLDEFIRRFPQFAKQLQTLFEVEQWIGDDDPMAVSELLTENGRDERKPDRTQTMNMPSASADVLADGAADHESSRYHVLRSHARGGLGEVFVAQDEELGREVALKEIRTQHADDPINRARFLQEAEITGRLEHPGIVPIYGLNTYKDGRPYYAMRFIQGESLKQAIQRFHSPGANREQAGRQAVELRQLLKHFQDSCHAIAYAHSRGIIHRDIKPDNIMLGEFGETLVVDWGLAKEYGESEETDANDETPSPNPDGPNELTQTGAVLGTPAYMSPEQAAGHLNDLKPSSDVYSLGATLYSLLTGTAPFRNGDVFSILDQVGRGEFTPPRQVNRAVPAPLDAICRKAMALHPHDRYQSAEDLSADIDCWLADEPVIAYKEPLLSRFARWRRKHRALVTGFSALVVALLLAAVVGTWMLSVEQTKTAETQTKLNRQQTQTLKAQKAELEEKDAKVKALDRAKKISSYLFGVLRSPDPTKNINAHDIRVGAVLDDAERNVEVDFKDDPLTRAAILNELALTWYNLGVPIKAVTLYERSWKIRKNTLGPNDPETLETMRLLGRALTYVGRSREAIPLLEDCLQRMQQNTSTDHPKVLAAVNDLGTAHHHVHQYDRAIPLFEKSLQQHQRKLGPDHQATLNTQAHLAHSYNGAGQSEKARKLAEEAYQSLKAANGADHPDTLFAMLTLAQSYAAQRDYDEAVPLLQKNLHLRQKRLGHKHRDTVTTMSHLGRAYMSLRRYDEAVALLEKASAIREESLGDDHPNTINARAHLGQTYHLTGQSGKAIPLLKSVLHWRQQEQGSDHPATLRTMAFLAESLHRTGNFNNAIPLYRETLKLARQSAKSQTMVANVQANLLEALHAASRFADAEALLGEQLKEARDTHPAESKELANQAWVVAWNLLKVQKYSQAEGLCRECLAIYEKEAPDHWLRFHTKSLLGSSLAGQQKFNEAEPLLIEGYEGMTEQAATIPAGDRPRLTEALQRLARLYTMWGKLESAKRWHEKLELHISAAAPLIREELTDTQLTKAHQVRMEAGHIYRIEHFAVAETALKIEDPRLNTSKVLLDNTPGIRLGLKPTMQADFIAPRTDDYRLTVSGDVRKPDGPYMIHVRELIPDKDIFTHRGKLTETDKASQNRIYHDHMIPLTAGVTYLVEQKSTSIDPFLFLLNAAGTRDLAANNDIVPDKNRNARIFFTPPLSAVYRIRASTYPLKQTGAYEVIVRPLESPAMSPEAMDRLASAYQHVGRFDYALPLLERVVSHRISQFGPPHPDTLRKQSELAHTFVYAERPTDAVPHFEEIYRHRMEHAKPDPNEQFVATVDLGIVYWVTGAYPKSLPLFEKAAKLKPTAIPQDIPWIICAVDENLARPEPATVTSAHKALETIGDKVDEGSPFQLTIQSGLALMKLQQQKPMPVNEIAKLRKRFDYYHPHLLVARRNQVIAYRQQGQFLKAAQILDHVRRTEENLYGNRDPRTLKTYMDLAHAEIQQDHFSVAERWSHQCQALCEKYQADHWLLSQAKSLRGECLSHLKNYAQAESLLLAGYDGLKSHAGPLSSSHKQRIVEAAQRLVRHYELRGEREKANLWRKKARLAENL